MDNQIDRVWISDALNHVGETILVKGWVQSRRDHGKLIFIDLRDKSGLLQVVFFAGNTELFDNASFLRSEFVVSIEGTVKSRSERQVNLDIPTGTIELSAESLQIINESETPVFEIEKASETKEELRMKYRYLDLRSERMRSNLVNRHRVIKLVRDSLDQQNFLEIETPYLTKGTPEGAREFIVPARLSPGDFFVLPQSPQQFKQLLMVGGVERYFQIARCFRDEDTRGDRQAEFTQMDLEMSFVSQEDIMDLNEKLLIKIVAELYPEKRIQTIPFPRITYKDAMEKYGSDRPDIREDKNDPNLLAFCWIVDFPMFEKTDTAWTFTHNPFSATIPEHTQWLRNKEHIGEIVAAQYDVVLNGSEIGGGSIRNYRSDDLRSVLEIIGHTSETIEQDFGHIFKAFSFGAPPHGGIAWGVDRLIMILQNEQSIRDVIAFPKTGDSRDLLMDAPNSINPKQLKELGL